MKKLKSILQKIISPPLPFVFAYAPAAFALLIVCSLTLNSRHPLTVCSYVMSAYALTIICVKIPGIRRKIIQFKRENKYIVRYNSDRKLREEISLGGSLLINTAFIVFNIILGFFADSSWHFSIAGYYFLLIFMRAFLFGRIHRSEAEKNIINDWKSYRLCGIVIIIMNTALSFMTMNLTSQSKTFNYGQIITIAMAAYTFWSAAMAISNAVKYRRLHSPAYSAGKIITLACAAVSVLTLTSTMLTTFDDGASGEFNHTMLLATGCIVCGFVLSLGVFMTINSTIKIRKLKRENTR